LAFESIVFVAVSFVVDRVRPDIEQLDSIPPTGSFPSGHSAAAVVFYGTIALVVLRNVQNRFARLFATSAAFAIPLMVSGSRVYRGMHYFSDVLFGLILGGVSLWLVWRTLRDHEQEVLATTN
jgi:undecaprenyl-diphosphatase